ncbi:hypothetical protein [Formosa haliotis]|uniref:hypothetical protein n=1 Tax=Formosa haliotis TaxID=1555194 RepID=UPI000825E095|nr:hypothetical protein [Formosa haliotis]
MKKISIDPKEVCIILGKSPSYARKVVRTIKKVLGKKKEHPLTITEFCKYMHLDVEEVRAEINGTQYVSRNINDKQNRKAS